NADRGVDRPGVVNDSGTFERLAHAFGGDHAFLQRARQQRRELLAADTPRQVRYPQRVDHNGGEQFQDLVARGMTEAVVDRFEVVDVEDQRRDRTAGI